MLSKCIRNMKILKYRWQVLQLVVVEPQFGEGGQAANVGWLKHELNTLLANFKEGKKEGEAEV